MNVLSISQSSDLTLGSGMLWVILYSVASYRPNFFTVKSAAMGPIGTSAFFPSPQQDSFCCDSDNECLNLLF